MTSIFQKNSTCVVCGTTTEFCVIGSTNRFGSPDLDTRPPEMERSTIQFWVQECPSCGYCAPDVAEPTDGTEARVRGEEYERQRRDPQLPPLANRFLCRALLQEWAGTPRQAFWSALFAAWVCDDIGTPEMTLACRARALAIANVARGQGQALMDQPGADEGILADLLRRSGRMEEVEPLCRAGLTKAMDPIVQKLLDFQIRLAAAKDAVRHTMDEVA